MNQDCIGLEERVEALARRAVACKGWRWMDGMRAFDGDGACSFRLTKNSGLPGHPEPVVDDSWFPDLTDPATLGCLIALVREAWNNRVVISIGNGWFQIETDVRDWDNDNTSSLLMALVSALEAAP